MQRIQFLLVLVITLILMPPGLAISTDMEWLSGSFNLTSTDSPEISNQLALGYSNGTISDDLNAYWRYDGNLNDYSGNAINPLSSQNVNFVKGLFNTSAADLRESQGSFIEYPNSKELNPRNFTFSAWVKPSGSNDKIIFEKSVSNDRGYVFLIDNYYGTDRVSLYLQSSTNGLQRFRTSTSLDRNTWQHIAATYNGSEVSLYINGSEQGLSRSSSATYNVSDQNLIFGASSTGGGGDYYNGSIDEVRIHSPFLSDTEVRREYFYGKPFKGDYVSKNFSSDVNANWFQARSTTSQPQGTEINLSLNTNQSTGYDTQTKTLSGGRQNTSFNLQNSQSAFFNLKGSSGSIIETWGADKIELDYLGAEIVKPEEEEVDRGGRVDFTYTIDSTVPGTAYIQVNGTDRRQKTFNQGKNTFTQFIDLNEDTYQSKIRLESDKGETFTTQNRNFTHLNKTDFKVNRILFNRTDFIENAPTEASVNVSNLEPDPGKSEVEANFSYYRSGTWNQYKSNNKTFDSIGDDSTRINFTFNPRMGPNRVVATADPENKINESDETNNQRSIIQDVPLYSIFYGESTKTTTLSNFEDKKFYDFGESDISGTVYYADTDASFSFSSLEPLKDYQDLQELDTSLNSTGFNDSIQKTWGNNNQIAKTSCFTISGNENCNVPAVNSTENSFFETGILYDGGTTYQEGDPVTFISDIVPSKQGSYGTYDYEIKVPGNLEENSGPNKKLDVYLEIE